MKPLHFFPPAIALVIAGLWIGSLRRSIAISDEQNERLEKHIAVARATDGTEETVQGESGVAGSTAGDKKPIDWKKAVLLMAETWEGVDDNRATMRFHEQLRTLTPDELCALLKECQSLDLREDFGLLESAILLHLVEKAPEMALKNFFDLRDHPLSMVGWRLSKALAAWAKQDAAAATTWFDQQIAAGLLDSKSLDGKNPTRVQFERSLLEVLFLADSQTAAHRLANLSLDQRKEVLSGMRYDVLEEKDQINLANLARQQLPQKDQAEVIARGISNTIIDDYSKITAGMNRIQASPTERAACIDRAVTANFNMLSFQRQITPEDVEKVRAWTRSDAPEATDRATGIALANAVNAKNYKRFSEFADLAEQYHQAGGGDEVILPLLEKGLATENKARARKLAERISDEKRRNDFLKKLN
jgi:hypothetical protein